MIDRICGTTCTLNGESGFPRRDDLSTHSLLVEHMRQKERGKNSEERSWRPPALPKINAIVANKQCSTAVQHYYVHLRTYTLPAIGKCPCRACFTLLVPVCPSAPVGAKSSSSPRDHSSVRSSHSLLRHTKSHSNIFSLPRLTWQAGQSADVHRESQKLSIRFDQIARVLFNVCGPQQVHAPWRNCGGQSLSVSALAVFWGERQKKR